MDVAGVVGTNIRYNSYDSDRPDTSFATQSAHLAMNTLRKANVWARRGQRTMQKHSS
jgi:hypothetical protein